MVNLGTKFAFVNKLYRIDFMKNFQLILPFQKLNFWFLETIWTKYGYYITQILKTFPTNQRPKTSLVALDQYQITDNQNSIKKENSDLVAPYENGKSL